MILFKTIRWRNFLSTGNTFTEIALDSSQATLIVGTNGAGKSTILDALTFSLFGKPFRKINKPQLVNSINAKECVAEVEFFIGSVEWKIVRGIKPNIFEIYKNGTKLDQNSSAADQQKWFEQNVLKLNFKSFTQIVILGSSTFVPFMQLPAAGRREVIEDILDIKIFSTMHILAKEKLRMINEEIRDLDSRAELVNEKINIQDRFIGELTSQSDKKISEKQEEIERLKNTKKILSGQIDECFTTVETLEKMYISPEKLHEKHDKLKSLSFQITSKKNLHNRDLKFFQQTDDCPTCGQHIDSSFKEEKISTYRDSVDEMVNALEKLDVELSSLKTNIDNIVSLADQIQEKKYDFRKLKNDCINIDNQVEYITKEISSIGNNNVDKEIEKRQEFLGQKKLLNDMISETKKARDEHDAINYLLKDSGVKTRIIKKYLPLINRTCREYLTQMDFSINFSLDGEFNETVKSPIHEDFSYSSFSEGEKMRIDLALLFTWREVARVKNSVNTNLLILDEIFDSSLDTSGTEDFLKIVRFAVKDANIFVISHKGDILQDKFADTIQFEKVKNFSKKVTVN
jgi:DNA repair exonuclease SbcCD ATPase subunit